MHEFNYVYYQFTLDDWYEVSVDGCATDINLLRGSVFIQSNDCNQPTCFAASDCEVYHIQLSSGTYIFGVGSEYSFQFTYFFQEL